MKPTPMPTKVNLLAISVGNTRTRIGAFVGGKLVEAACFENQRRSELADALDHAFSPLREREDGVVLMSSVNPPVAEEVEALVARVLGRPPKRVERDIPVPVGRQLDREALVGEDRLLNAANVLGAPSQKEHQLSHRIQLMRFVFFQNELTDLFPKNCASRLARQKDRTSIFFK